MSWPTDWCRSTPPRLAQVQTDMKTTRSQSVVHDLIMGQRRCECFGAASQIRAGRSRLAVRSRSPAGLNPAHINKPDYRAGTGASSAGLRDLNGDGNFDLIIFGDGISALFCNGDGTFRAAVSYSDGTIISGAVGDFNGDGKLDWVIITAPYQALATVWLNTSCSAGPNLAILRNALRSLFPGPFPPSGLCSNRRRASARRIGLPLSKLR